MTLTAPICILCKRYNRNSTCTSFPDGIPASILWEGGAHYVPLGNEPVFSPMDAQSQETATRIWGEPPRASGRLSRRLS